MLRRLNDRTELEYAILAALEERSADHRYNRVTVAGHSESEVDEVIRYLVEKGFVDGLWIDGEPGHYDPSGLSESGRDRLTVLRRMTLESSRGIPKS